LCYDLLRFSHRSEICAMEYAYMQGRVIAHPICNLHASHRRFFPLLPIPSVVISPTTTPNYTAHFYS
jgi:hypothetical protein